MGGPLPWIRQCNESNLTDLRTCTEGKSRGSLYVTLAALQLSLPQRPLCVVGRLGERKRKRAGHDVLHLFLLGYPAGTSAEERGSVMYRFLTLYSFLLVAYPQIGSAYVKERTMTLKYRSKSFFLGKKRERLIRFQFVNKPSFQKVEFDRPGERSPE